MACTCFEYSSVRICWASRLIGEWVCKLARRLADAIALLFARQVVQAVMLALSFVDTEVSGWSGSEDPGSWVYVIVEVVPGREIG